MVPHLTTALTGPLLDMERMILGATPQIERWFRNQWQEHAAPFYTSVDLRNSGFKLAPVDTNLYPGGFNNLNSDFIPLAVQAAMGAVEKICPDAQRLLLIPENHTRNLFYLQSVAQLANILRQTGMEVRLGSLIPDLVEPLKVDLPDGGSLLLEPVVRNGNRVGVAGYNPCAILLNNDLSGGIPPLLRNLEQSMLPPLHAGWHIRRKSRHFAAYDQVATEFAELIGLDPWFINPYFSTCGRVNFQERQGEECLEKNATIVLDKIRKKYDEYKIDAEPFVIAKADAGTYGMGIMTVKDPSQVRELNRKQRNKMAVGKEGQQISEVIIQEGVHTFESINDAVAEPVVYMIDHFVIGGFYRVHTGRGPDENLNAPGMHFVPLAFATPCCTPNQLANPDSTPNRFYTYGVVARLAMLAASMELEQTDPENQ
ncbi:MAG: glutamate--cysteine ligase [Pseudomonadota bacterium]